MNTVLSEEKVVSNGTEEKKSNLRSRISQPDQNTGAESGVHQPSIHSIRDLQSEVPLPTAVWKVIHRDVNRKYLEHLFTTYFSLKNQELTFYVRMDAVVLTRSGMKFPISRMF